MAPHNSPADAKSTVPLEDESSAISRAYLLIAQLSQRPVSQKFWPKEVHHLEESDEDRYEARTRRAV